MKKLTFLIILICFASITGCATMPTSPSVRVYPGSDKTFEEFQADDVHCRIWADQRVGMPPDEIRNQSTAAGAGVGTVLGAGLGALIGSASGNAGVGAAIGAGSGMLIGASAGSDQGRVYGYEAQRRYDTLYLQCMYSRGNQVPGAVTPRRYRQNNRYVPPPPPPTPYSAPHYPPPPDVQDAPYGTPPPF